jgi:hypothetical protein
MMATAAPNPHLLCVVCDRDFAPREGDLIARLSIAGGLALAMYAICHHCLLAITGTVRGQ